MRKIEGVDGRDKPGHDGFFGQPPRPVKGRTGASA
jgi:hypothetical protein